MTLTRAQMILVGRALAIAAGVYDREARHLASIRDADACQAAKREAKACRALRDTLTELVGMMPRERPANECDAPR